MFALSQPLITRSLIRVHTDHTVIKLGDEK